MDRAEAIETARAVLANGPYCHADAMALATFVLETFKSIEAVVSPSTASHDSGGGESPAAPANAPVSTQSVAVSPARHLGGPSGLFEANEPDTTKDLVRVPNAATVPTVYPTVGLAWQDDRIAGWLEGHAKGYEHSGDIVIARVLRKKADGVRRREYLEP